MPRKSSKSTSVTQGALPLFGDSVSQEVLEEVAHVLSGKTDHVFTVSELTDYVKEAFKSDPVLGRSLKAQGELSNVKKSSRGHVYMNLRDESASVSCIVWASTAIRLPFDLDEGLEVFATGTMEIYAPNGTYSLVIKKLEPVGVGALQLAFEQLKERLAAEGLFDPDHKQPIPPFPKKIGVITAKTGAVIHDMIRVQQRKNPGVSLLLYPVPVQGEGAALAIAQAIQELNHPDYGLDTLIVARGGGSFEDLYCFSEEPVVRAIFNSKIPVITGIGHEPDYGLADVVADYSAATPTAAMDYALPDLEQIEASLIHAHSALAQGLERCMLFQEQQMDHLSTRFLDRFQQILMGLETQLTQCQSSMLFDCRHHQQRWEGWIGQCASELDAYSPLTTLARGYAVATTPQGQVITTPSQVSPGDPLELRVQGGTIPCQVRQ